MTEGKVSQSLHKLLTSDKVTLGITLISLAIKSKIRTFPKICEANLADSLISRSWATLNISLLNLIVINWTK